MVIKHLITIGKTGSFLFTIAFSILTLHYLYNEGDKPLAVGCLSVAIASLSVFLAVCSERRMHVLIESEYNSQFSELNTRRLDLREKLINYQGMILGGATRAQLTQDEISYRVYHSFSMWKCLRYLKSLIGLKDYFDTSKQNEVIHEIDCLFQDLGDGKTEFTINLDDNQKGQILRMYELVSELAIFNNNSGRVLRMHDNYRFLRDEGPTQVTHF